VKIPSICKIHPFMTAEQLETQKESGFHMHKIPPERPKEGTAYQALGYDPK
jgi:hypothetical protein